MLETERLLLRKFKIEDYVAVYEFNSNAEVHKFTGDEVLKSLDRAKEIITKTWEKDYSVHGYGRMATIYKPDNKIIGFAGLKFLPEFNETDIGFRFLPEYWGKGIATEASREILKYGFNNIGLNRIIGIAMKENIASSKVLEKIGLRFYKEAPYYEGGIICNWYKIDKEEYCQNITIDPPLLKE